MHKLLQRVKVKVASRLAREQAYGGGGEGLEVETEGSEWKFAGDDTNSKDMMIQVIMLTHYVK